MNTSSVVQKLWNYCYGPGLGQSRTRSPAREYAGTREKPRFALRDDGMSYGDYPGSSPGQANYEQLTYLLFLKMADERTKAPYNQKSPVPQKYSWPSALTPTLSQRERGNSYDGDELFDHYRADQGG